VDDSAVEFLPGGWLCGLLAATFHGCGGWVKTAAADAATARKI